MKLLKINNLIFNSFISVLDHRRIFGFMYPQNLRFLGYIKLKRFNTFV